MSSWFRGFIHSELRNIFCAWCYKCQSGLKMATGHFCCCFPAMSPEPSEAEQVIEEADALAMAQQPQLLHSHLLLCLCSEDGCWGKAEPCKQTSLPASAHSPKHRLNPLHTPKLSGNVTKASDLQHRFVLSKLSGTARSVLILGQEWPLRINTAWLTQLTAQLWLHSAVGEPGYPAGRWRPALWPLWSSADTWHKSHWMHLPISNTAFPVKKGVLSPLPHQSASTWLTTTNHRNPMGSKDTCYLFHSYSKECS